MQIRSRHEFCEVLIAARAVLLQCSSAAGAGAKGGAGPAGGAVTMEMNQTPTQRLLVDAQKFQMMDGAVQPTRIQPFVVAENERYDQKSRSCSYLIKRDARS